MAFQCIDPKCPEAATYHDHPSPCSQVSSADGMHVFGNGTGYVAGDNAEDGYGDYSCRECGDWISFV